jgi:hypothetical protein
VCCSGASIRAFSPSLLTARYAGTTPYMPSARGQSVSHMTPTSPLGASGPPKIAETTRAAVQAI